MLRSARSITLMILVALSLSACREPVDSSELEGLTAEREAKNVALIMGWEGAPGREARLPGTGPDLVRLKALYESDDFDFEVIVIKDPTRERVLQASADAARSVGARGTLLWHFEGHGSEDGRLWADDGAFTFPEVAAAIGGARTTPLKRLLVTVDTCYSGNLVDGTNQVSYSQSDANIFADAATGAFAGARSYSAKALAAETFVLASATSAQTAADWGADPNNAMNGGPFNQAMVRVFASYARDYRKTATIDDFTAAVKSWVQTNTSFKQEPVSRTTPRVLGGQLLFAPRNEDLPDCPGAWNLPWAKDHERTTSGGSCRNPESYCQCWRSRAGGCGLFPKGSAGGTPLARTRTTDANGGCYDSCEALVRDNKALVRAQCGTELIMLNASSQLEVWDYRQTLGNVSEPPQPPEPPPAASSCRCESYQENGKFFCGYRKGGEMAGFERFGPFGDAGAMTCSESCPRLPKPSGC